MKDRHSVCYLSLPLTTNLYRTSESPFRLKRSTELTEGGPKSSILAEVGDDDEIADVSPKPRSRTVRCMTQLRAAILLLSFDPACQLISQSPIVQSRARSIRLERGRCLYLFKARLIHRDVMFMRGGRCMIDNRRYLCEASRRTDEGLGVLLMAFCYACRKIVFFHHARCQISDLPMTQLFTFLFARRPDSKAKMACTAATDA